MQIFKKMLPLAGVAFETTNNIFDFRYIANAWPIKRTGKLLSDQ